MTGIAKFAGSGGAALLPSLTKIKDAAAKALAEFKIEQPELIAPHLAAGLREVRALRATLGSLDAVSKANVDGMLATKEQQFNDALARAHGVVVDALSNTEIVTPGEAVDVSANVYFRASAGNPVPSATLKAPAKWQIAPLGSEPEPQGGGGFRGRETPAFVARFRATVPEGEPSTQPYWLAKPRTKDQYEWDATMPQTLPFAPAVATARVELTLSGERVVINQPVEYRFSDKTFGEIRRELKVAPAVTLTVNPQLLVIPSESPNRTREISVEITDNARRAINGSVKLIAPQGWKVELDPRPLSFTKQGEKTARTFKVTPPTGANGAFDLQAVAEEGSKTYENGYTAISYPHIETHFLYRAAKTKVEVFDAKVAANLKVGYVMGSGDDGPQALQQLGVNVHLISAAELASADLSGYDTIVLGIRVYEVNEDVIANNKRLLEYVSNGGTLIVQYNKQEFASGNFAPYPVKMRGERVTDEMAPVTVLVPDHPLFNFPNKIGPDDLNDWRRRKNWVQERGLYFLSEWDSHYTPLLAAPDDTGKVLNGGQLIAQYGKGNYIFTGYAWFRQFPVGTPGAYRMFANLVSYSKAAKK